MSGLIIDLFAGGGGASLGIEWALGRSPDIAVNHDPEALAMHAANHPRTTHLRVDIREFNPRDVCGGRAVDLLWLSPDCTFHSKARGCKPFRDRHDARGRRGLAWVAVRWAKEVAPSVICLENVEEFQQWGPLGADGKPCPARAGLTFRRFVGCLKSAGYAVEWRELRACDYGAPTIRKRLFLIARRDGKPIAWPRPTHGPGRVPYRTAAECIDWSLPCPSIFGRKRPLAEKTLARVARGIRKFVLENPKPFLVPMTHAGDHRVYPIDEPMRTVAAAHRGEQAVVTATLQHSGNGERQGQEPRVYDIQKPLSTVMAQGQKHALVTAFLARHNEGTGNDGVDLRRPISTVTSRDHHSLVTVELGRDRRTEVAAFLTKFYGTCTGQDVQLPLGTVTADGWKHGLVTVAGVPYEIADIGLRMLGPRELFRAQGFPDAYVIDVGPDGKTLSKTAQIRMCGNSVCPQMAQAIVAANVEMSAEVAAE